MMINKLQLILFVFLTSGMLSAQVQKGNQILGEHLGDYGGFSVSMPNANIIAIGAHENDDNGIGAGHVRIFEWDGTTWIQKGGDIDGESGGDISGSAVSMPSENTLAIGARSNDGNGPNAGHVRVYKWDGNSWTQKGSDLDGQASHDLFGCSVSMPNDQTIAIGGKRHDSQAGHVQVFQWNGNS